MADQFEALMGKLDQLIGQKQVAPSVVQAAPMNGFAAPPGFMSQPTQPVPAAAMQAFGQVPGYAAQPTGISVPVNVLLPDGSEMTLYIQYGPEHAANPQAFIQMVMATYGQSLRTFRPRWQGGFGHGGYGGAGYGGFNGRGRRY